MSQLLGSGSLGAAGAGGGRKVPLPMMPDVWGVQEKTMDWVCGERQHARASAHMLCRRLQQGTQAGRRPRRELTLAWKAAGRLPVTLQLRPALHVVWLKPTVLRTHTPGGQQARCRSSSARRPAHGLSQQHA